MERTFDADARGGDVTEEEGRDGDGEDDDDGEDQGDGGEEEEENEGGLHSEARELESMLRSFETDLNRGEREDCTM